MNHPRRFSPSLAAIAACSLAIVHAPDSASGAAAPAHAPRILSVEDVLNAPDLKEETVDVPEWGGAVRIRAFTKAGQQSMREQASVVTFEDGKPVQKVDEKRLELLMFINGVVEPAFTPDQVDALAGKAAGPVDRIIKRVLAISGLGAESVKAAEKSASA